MNEEPITAALLSRYDRPGPRYTSYPTAPRFHTDFGPADYGRRLTAAASRPDEPLSLYVHLPFCARRCLYCGCHVVIARKEAPVRDYLGYLMREIDLVAEALGRRRRVLQLHWGGGTPTHLGPDRIRELFGRLTERFELLPGAEVALEVDPRVTTEAHVEALRDLGFNRLSLGVQDFTPEVQAAIGRDQTLAQTQDLVARCRASGLGDFNVDLIYGLPRQSLPTFRDSLRQVIELRPGRVAVYSYAHVPWMRPHQRRIDASELPDRERKFELFAAAIEAFTDAGYVQIGMDHFALPGDELARAQADGTLTRNFMGYTVRAAPDLVALGISGIGDVDGAFVQNRKKLSDYYRDLDAGRLPVERGYRLNGDDRIRRHVIRSLMCNFELDDAELERRFGVRFGEYFREERRRISEEIDPSFVELSPAGLRVTARGRLFVRNLCMIFDRYLDAPDGRPLYSQTV